MEELLFLWNFPGETEKKSNLSSNNSCPSRDSTVAYPEYNSASLLHERTSSGVKKNCFKRIRVISILRCNNILSLNRILVVRKIGLPS